MLEAFLRLLKRERKAVSNVIVAMLSLVLITIIVGNVVLWSYQMNQFDLERMQENMTVLNVTKTSRSPWFALDKEYSVDVGARISGTFIDTDSVGNSFETFAEELTVYGSYRLDLTNNFAVDFSTYQLDRIKGIELIVVYNISDTGDMWFLTLYNWSASAFGDFGFNTTTGSQPVLGMWNEYSLSVTEEWMDYVNPNGTLFVKFADDGADLDQTVVGVDFLGVRVLIEGTAFDLRNSGPLTIHVVSIWINNITHHFRYSADFYVNSGASETYVRPDISYLETQFSAKITTEKGNIFVFVQI